MVLRGFEGGVGLTVSNIKICRGGTLPYPYLIKSFLKLLATGTLLFTLLCTSRVEYQYQYSTRLINLKSRVEYSTVLV